MCKSDAESIEQEWLGVIEDQWDRHMEASKFYARLVPVMMCGWPKTSQISNFGGPVLGANKRPGARSG